MEPLESSALKLVGGLAYMRMSTPRAVRIGTENRRNGRQLGRVHGGVAEYSERAARHALPAQPAVVVDVRIDAVDGRLDPGGAGSDDQV